MGIRSGKQDGQVSPRNREWRGHNANSPLPQLLLAMCIFAHTWAGENRTGILVVFSRLILVTSSYLAGFTTTSAAACHIPINNTLNAQQMASADGWVESGD